MRRAHDYYQTPQWCVSELLDHLHREWLLPEGVWLDPAAGDGAILRAAGAWLDKNPGAAVGPRALTPLSVELQAYELQERFQAELVASLAREPRPLCNVSIGDFLTDPFDPDCELSERVTLVLCNPPYNKALAFVDRARKVCPRALCCFLLRLGFLASDVRARFLSEFPPDLAVLARRPSFKGNGSDFSDYGWHCWPAGGDPRRSGRLVVLPCEEQSLPLFGSEHV